MLAHPVDLDGLSNCINLRLDFGLFAVLAHCDAPIVYRLRARSAVREPYDYCTTSLTLCQVLLCNIELRHGHVIKTSYGVFSIAGGTIPLVKSWRVPFRRGRLAQLKLRSIVFIFCVPEESIFYIYLTPFFSRVLISSIRFPQGVLMAKLTAKARGQISNKNFALPGRRYPIEDKSHARAALSMVSKYGTAIEKARVRSAVHTKYPKMGKK